MVLNWCNEEVSRECLRSLAQADFPSLTVLLVDNGSPDESGERLREAFPNINYLQTGSNLGYTGGNNRGIEWALEHGTDYVLILNNDTVVTPESILRLVEVAEDGGETVGGVVPKILFVDAPERIWYAGGEFSILRGLGLHWREGEIDGPDSPEEVREVTFMTGCCCLLSAEAIRTVGGFDEGFFAYVEDAELSIRLREAGYAMLYQPRARVLHHSLPPGEDPSPFRIRQRDRNRRRVMRKHFSFFHRVPFLVRFYVTRVALLLRYVVRGDLSRAGAILQGMGMT